jgi:predicted membrane protein
MSNNYSDWNEDRARRTSRGVHSGIYAGHGEHHHHMVMGIIVLGLGVLFLLQNLGYFYIHNIWQFWPVILIAVGVSHILQAFALRSKIWGAVIAGVGVLFLARNLGYLPWNVWHLIWPLAIICAGLNMLLRGFSGGRPWDGPRSSIHDASTISDNFFREDVVFGGINRKIQAQDFQGGSASAVFGGIEIDLRGSATTKDEIYIEASAIFGGVELKVPYTWDVIVRGSGLLGGYDDKTDPSPAIGDAKRPRLIIRGSAVFGGVSIRN